MHKTIETARLSIKTNKIFWPSVCGPILSGGQDEDGRGLQASIVFKIKYHPLRPRKVGALRSANKICDPEVNIFSEEELFRTNSLGKQGTAYANPADLMLHSNLGRCQDIYTNDTTTPRVWTIVEGLCFAMCSFLGVK